MCFIFFPSKYNKKVRKTVFVAIPYSWLTTKAWLTLWGSPQLCLFRVQFLTSIRMLTFFKEYLKTKVFSCFRTTNIKKTKIDQKGWEWQNNISTTSTRKLVEIHNRCWLVYLTVTTISILLHFRSECTKQGTHCYCCN